MTEPARLPGGAVDLSWMRPAAARGIKAPTASVAVGPGSSSAGRVIRSLFKAYEPLAYSIPFELLDYIELLATYNPDYSQAVENVKTLANSGHDLFVSAGSNLQERRIREQLEESARNVQQQHGGIDGLIDKLLDQAATFGAMCGEWILDDDLTTVIDFADVNPKTIRFFWDSQFQKWWPYQKVTTSQADDAKKNGQEVLNGCVRLNPVTFHYFAFDAAPGSPYGVPPFLAALENIGIQRDMVRNMSQIVKKIGLLGIIDVIIKAIPPKPGEKEDEYMARAQSYLDAYTEAIEQMVAEGGMAHFDDVEIKPTSIGGNAAGATNIFKQNEELIFSGLKSMPSVQGRSYSTTETYAGVAYDIIIRNTKSYQRGCKRMIESGYWLIASLGGQNPEKISLRFHENKTLHRLQDAQAEAVEIKNALIKWLCGLLDQLGFAQELGFPTVVTEMDKPPPEAIGGKAGDLNTGAEAPPGGDAPATDASAGFPYDDKDEELA